MYELTEADYRKAERIARWHCRYVHSRQDADDCMQEARIALWQKAKAYNPEVGDFWTFARRRVSGAALDVIRKKTNYRRGECRQERHFMSLDAVWKPKRRGGREIIPESYYLYDKLLPPVPAPECEPRLERAIESLRPRHREVIRRKYWGGEVLREIGENMGFGEPRSAQIHKIALDKLYQQLKPSHRTQYEVKS